MSYLSPRIRMKGLHYLFFVWACLARQAKTILTITFNFLSDPLAVVAVGTPRGIYRGGSY